MNVNVTSFKVEFRKQDFVRFTMNTYEREQVDPYPTYYLISKEEIPLVLDCMRGVSKFWPLFQDGYHKIAFYPTEIYSFELDKLDWKCWHFTLPLKNMAVLQDALQNWYDNPSETTYELTKNDLDKIRCENRNRVKWHYQNITNGKWDNFKFVEWVEYPIIPRILADCKTNPELKRNLTSLTRIAANHSYFGEKNTVTISFDDGWYDSHHEEKPASYYFDIRTPENRRIMNGGIIAHERNDHTYEYSMHT